MVCVQSVANLCLQGHMLVLLPGAVRCSQWLHGQHSRSLLCWIMPAVVVAGKLDFGSFMRFTESITGEDFVAYLCSSRQLVITEIIAIASDAPDWNNGAAMPQVSSSREFVDCVLPSGRIFVHMPI